jgi:hypothetical protein
VLTIDVIAALIYCNGATTFIMPFTVPFIVVEIYDPGIFKDGSLNSIVLFNIYMDEIRSDAEFTFLIIALEYEKIAFVFFNSLERFPSTRIVAEIGHDPDPNSICVVVK